MTVTRFVDIAKIKRRSDARAEDPATHAALRESIARSPGRQPREPVGVRLLEDGWWELIFGNHRLTVVAELGETQVFAVEVKANDLEAEAMMLEENLLRHELSPVDRVVQSARLKAIYEQLHPETKAGVAGAMASNAAQGNATANLATASFTASTAAATRQSERTVRRETARGGKLDPGVADIIRDTPLNSGTYLDKLTKVPREKQVEKARADLAKHRAEDGEKKAKAAADRAEATSKRRAEQSDQAAATSPSSSKPEPPPLDGYAILLEMSDRLIGVDATSVVAACPPKQRAALASRLSPLIDLMQDILDGVSA